MTNGRGNIPYGLQHDASMDMVFGQRLHTAADQVRANIRPT
jgi:hypothetical protein